ncbi:MULTISPECIES: lytic murein transglycosylase [unclassified Moraxella]|uniref:lytic murein transglycosylase n=1 Tax=unclassified Moraxella TaxID=2685852 RepID=UPI003AF5076D
MSYPRPHHHATFTSTLSKIALATGMGSLIVACSTTPTPQPNTTVEAFPPIITTPTPQPMPTPTVTPTKSYASFASWQNDFVERASAKGYNRNDVQRLMSMASYNAQVVSLDKNQAEFVKMPWEYIDGAVSTSRVSGGKRNFVANSDMLTRIENQYGVPASIVTAIWGMESSYGAGTGSSSLPSALATLAYDGRRQNFAEEQLLALLTLINRGDIQWSQLTGSWAGGMGHTQFIPTTWLKEGVDGNGDGHKNPWNREDALASTASYLKNSGWQRGMASFYEAKLPNGFDYRQVGQKKSIADWQKLGVQVLSNAPSYATAELWLPAGKDGASILLTQNFDAIKTYNNSNNYAMGVSLLARAIIGQSGLQQDFPRYEKPLSTYQVRQLQQRLTSMGYDTKGSDGVIGTNTKLAFQRWQAGNGQIADGFISQRTASMLAN